jgi:hypothetical protein
MMNLLIPESDMAFEMRQQITRMHRLCDNFLQACQIRLYPNLAKPKTKSY